MSDSFCSVILCITPTKCLSEILARLISIGVSTLLNKFKILQSLIKNSLLSEEFIVSIISDFSEHISFFRLIFLRFSSLMPESVSQAWFACSIFPSLSVTKIPSAQFVIIPLSLALDFTRSAVRSSTIFSRLWEYFSSSLWAASSSVIFCLSWESK